MPGETPDAPGPRRTRVLVIVAALAAVAAVIIAVLVLARGGSSSDTGAVAGVRHVGDLDEIGEPGVLAEALERAADSKDGAGKVSGAERRDIVGCVDSLEASLAPSRREELRLELTGLASHTGEPAVVLAYGIEQGAGEGGLQVFVLQRADCAIVAAQTL